MVIAGLLFLSFAYFAVGQAAANRNDAQGAADAAAVAAANEARKQIGQDLLDEIENLDAWEDLLAGLLFPSAPSCAEAEKFAAKNKASSDSCTRIPLPRQGFEVDVETLKSVGSSLIPGTESTKSTAGATAVIEPRCTLKTDPDDDKVEEIVLTCKGEDVSVDPDDPDPLPDLDELFTVRLVD